MVQLGSGFLGYEEKYLFPKFHQSVGGALSMNSKVRCLTIFVNRASVENGSDMFDHPSHYRMCGCNADLDSGFKGRLQGAKQVFDRLHSALGTTVGSTFSNSAVLADCLRQA